MDIKKLENFTKEVKELIELNNNLVDDLNKTELLLNSATEKISILEKKEKNHDNEIKNINSGFEKEINILKETIDNLKKENNEKSSKTIWETTQNKIKEKDEQIEELKKTIEFLKRTQTVLTGNVTEVKQEPVKQVVKETVKEPVKETVKEPVKEIVKEIIEDSLSEELKKEKIEPEKPKKKVIKKIVKKPVKKVVDDDLDEDLERKLNSL